MKSITALQPLLETPKHIFITSHYKPDADAIGSSLGLYHYLVQLGHNVSVVSPSEVPDFLLWMPDVEVVINYETDTEKAVKLLNDADLIFCLDFNHPSRVKHLEDALTNALAPKVIIDHHLEPLTAFFTYGISQPEKSSTCEMVYDFINTMGGAAKINQSIMQCLYAGCMTDTGSFRFPATTASVHEMIADFKHRGLEHSKIHQEIYDTYSVNRLKIIGLLLNKIDIDEVHQFSIMALSQKEAQQFDIQSGDTEGIVNMALSVKSIQLSILLTERTEEIRISFRSKGDIDVSTFARTYFNGGGHFNAAGGQSKLSLEETIQQIKNLIISTKLTSK